MFHVPENILQYLIKLKITEEKNNFKNLYLILSYKNVSIIICELFKLDTL